jgi:hypothetical protein
LKKLGCFDFQTNLTKEELFVKSKISGLRYETVVAQFMPLLSRHRQEKGGDWAFCGVDESSNYIHG